MERRGIETAEVYRGISGDKIVNKMKSSIKQTEGMRRTRFYYNESPIVGTSSKRHVADEKMGYSGVMVKYRVSRENVILHEDLLANITRGFKNEHEYWIKGGRLQIDIKDIIIQE